tara:strand:+ start:134 stop:1990 length:1857 start_codon:yes stop_codon:yes gene_type:complete
MSGSEKSRKIAVIFVADVVGYSKHMENDEDATLKAFADCEKILKKLLKKYVGSIFNTGGDSALVEFPSAVNAVECAVDFQNEIKERNASDKIETKLEFRIGINMGDVVQKEGNLLGDGVNIAARLEALAQPNGITISKSVYDLVVPKTKVTFNDLGVQKVKQNTFHAYDILLDPSQKRKLKTQSTPYTTLLSGTAAALVIAIAGFFMLNGEEEEEMKTVVADRPSILIMDFENMTMNDENKFLGIGMTSNIIATLNKTGGHEIPPSSTKKFIIENKLDNEKISQDYGIQFIVTGSIQGTKEKLRITTEMTDLVKNRVIWSEIYNFDKESDIFDIQDEVALSILKATQVKIDLSPAEPISEDPEVYKLALKGGSSFGENTPAGNQASFEITTNILKKEPNNYRILTSLAWIHWQRIYLGISKDPKDDIKDGLQFAEKALNIKPNYPNALAVSGSLNMMAGNFDLGCKTMLLVDEFAEEITDRALGAGAQYFCGKLDVAIPNFEYVITKAPHFPSWVKYLYGYALTDRGEYDKALNFFETELQKDHAWSGSSQTMYLLSAFINLKRGDKKKAEELFEKQKALDGKGKTAKQIKGELFGAIDKTFLNEFLDALAPFGLPQE